MRFQHILFPLDFSAHSLAMIPTVEWLANAFGARVTMLHVVEIAPTWYGASEVPIIDFNVVERLEEAAKKQLEQLKVGIRPEHLARVALQGDPAWQICDFVKRHNDVDLIVMGTHGYGKLKGLAIGSVLAKVMHAVDVPVWTSAPHAGLAGMTVPPQHVLCAVDGGRESVPLLRFAKVFAELTGAGIKLIHVVPEAASRPNLYLDNEYHRFLVQLAKEEIAKAQEEAETEFPLLLDEHGIETGMQSVVDGEKADLLLVGRGHSRLTLGTLRTHVFELVRRVNCPVLSFCQSDARVGDKVIAASSAITNTADVQQAGLKG